MTTNKRFRGFDHFHCDDQVIQTILETVHHPVSKRLQKQKKILFTGCTSVSLLVIAAVAVVLLRSPTSLITGVRPNVPDMTFDYPSSPDIILSDKSRNLGEYLLTLQPQQTTGSFGAPIGSYLSGYQLMGNIDQYRSLTEIDTYYKAELTKQQMRGILVNSLKTMNKDANLLTCLTIDNGYDQSKTDPDVTKSCTITYYPKTTDTQEYNGSPPYAFITYTHDDRTTIQVNQDGSTLISQNFSVTDHALFTSASDLSDQQIIDYLQKSSLASFINLTEYDVIRTISGHTNEEEALYDISLQAKQATFQETLLTAIPVYLYEAADINTLTVGFTLPAPMAYYSTYSLLNIAEATDLLRQGITIDSPAVTFAQENNYDLSAMEILAVSLVYLNQPNQLETIPVYEFILTSDQLSEDFGRTSSVISTLTVHVLAVDQSYVTHTQP